MKVKVQPKKTFTINHHIQHFANVLGVESFYFEGDLCICTAILSIENRVYLRSILPDGKFIPAKWVTLKSN